MIKAVGPFDVYHETIGKLAGNGIILLAGDPPNPMTIGWGTTGEIWHMPIFTVLVRPWIPRSMKNITRPLTGIWCITGRSWGPL